MRPVGFIYFFKYSIEALKPHNDFAALHTTVPWKSWILYVPYLLAGTGSNLIYSRGTLLFYDSQDLFRLYLYF